MKEFDFLPQSFRDAVRRRRQARKNLIYSFALAGGLVALHLANASQIRSAEAALSALRVDGGMWKSARTEVASLESRKNLLQKRGEIISRLEDGAPLDAIIGEITSLLSPSMAISSFTLEAKRKMADDTKDQTSTESRKTTRVTIAGIAGSDVEIGIFFGRLSACPLFENVTMSFCRETKQSGRTLREFELGFDVKRIALDL